MNTVDPQDTRSRASWIAYVAIAVSVVTLMLVVIVWRDVRYIHDYIGRIPCRKRITSDVADNPELFMKALDDCAR